MQHLPVVEVLHEIDFCFEGVDLYLQATREAYLLHGEQLPGTLVQSFEHLRLFLPATHADNDTKRDFFRGYTGYWGFLAQAVIENRSCRWRGGNCRPSCVRPAPRLVDDPIEQRGAG